MAQNYSFYVINLFKYIGEIDQVALTYFLFDINKKNYNHFDQFYEKVETFFS
jgi:hypothetical protein